MTEKECDLYAIAGEKARQCARNAIFNPCRPNGADPLLDKAARRAMRSTLIELGAVIERPGDEADHDIAWRRMQEVAWEMYQESYRFDIGIACGERAYWQVMKERKLAVEGRIDR